jgi:hypothetical protein
MADFIVINGTDADLENVNAGGADVVARTVSVPITLTGAELLVVAAMNGVAVMQTGATAAEQGAVIAALIDNNVSNIDLSTLAKIENFKLKRGREEADAILALLN